jgi:hypothetical protein
MKGKGQLFYVFQPTSTGPHKFILDNSKVNYGFNSSINQLRKSHSLFIQEITLTRH